MRQMGANLRELLVIPKRTGIKDTMFLVVAVLCLALLVARPASNGRATFSVLHSVCLYYDDVLSESLGYVDLCKARCCSPVVPAADLDLVADEVEGIQVPPVVHAAVDCAATLEPSADPKACALKTNLRSHRLAVPAKALHKPHIFRSGRSTHTRCRSGHPAAAAAR